MKRIKRFAIAFIAIFLMALAAPAWGQAFYVTVVRATEIEGYGWNNMERYGQVEMVYIPAILHMGEDSMSLFFKNNSKFFRSTRPIVNYYDNGRNNFYFDGVTSDRKTVKLTLSIPDDPSEELWFVVDFFAWKMVFTLVYSSENY